MDQKTFNKIIDEEIPEKLRNERKSALFVLLDGSYRIFGSHLNENQVRLYGRYLKMYLESENMRTNSATDEVRLTEAIKYNQQLEKIIVGLKKEALDIR